MSESKEILKYFNSYYYFAQLTQNAHTIPHKSHVLKNKGLILKDIETFYETKNEEKHITEKHTIFNDEEKTLKILPSKQLRNFAQKIASNIPHLSEYRFKKLLKEHQEEIEELDLKTNTEKLKFLIKQGYLKFNQKFILALSTLNLTLVTKDEKVYSFIYPIEYIELDEYNSAILTGINYTKVIKDNKKKSTLLIDEYIEISLDNLPIIRNEFIFDKFLPKFPKEKPSDNEDEYPTLSYLMNKHLEKITFAEIKQFLRDRSKQLKEYLVAIEEDFIVRIDIPDSILDNNRGLVIFNEIQNSQVNFDLLLRDKLSISKPLKSYLSINYEEKKSYSNNFTDYFVPYYGTNTKEYSLAKGQAKVLENYVKSQSLISVIGAPGTGKTTLFKSIIANNITSRALSIILKNKDYNNLMLMTSTARKAVDNVIKDIEEENPFMGALVLLSKEDSEENNRRAKALSQFLKPIKEVIKENLFSTKKFKEFIEKFYKTEETEDTFLDAYEHYHKFEIARTIQEFKEEFPFIDEIKEIDSKYLKTQILKTKEYIDKSIEVFNNKEKLEVNINKLREEFDILQKEVKSFAQKVDLLIDRFEGEELGEIIESENIIIEYADFFLGNELTFLLDEFETSYEKLKKSGILVNLINNLLKKEEKLFKNYKKKFKLTYLSNKEFLETIQEIKDIRKNYNTYIKKAKQLNELKEIINKIEHMHNIFKELGISLEEIEKYDDIKEFYRLTPKIYKANFLLYKLSESFLVLDTYEKIDKEDLTPILSKLKETLELNNKTLKDKSKDEIKNNILIASRFFPVIGATIKKINLIYSASKYNNTKDMEFSKFYHTILIDEAGMIPSADAIHSINIGKQALVVGDPKQLEPIPEIPEILKDEFTNYIKKKNSENVKYHKIFSPIDFSAYDIASGISILKYEDEKNEDFIGKSYLLDEHRRCQKDIAELFIKVANYPDDLKIKTPKDLPNYLLKDKNGKARYLEFYDCQLNEKPKIKNTNPLEVEAINTILEDLKKRGVNLSTQVGIITPFANQSFELINKFGTLLGHSDNKQKIGTVHKFQGAEFDIIIFSSVLNPHNKAISFVADNINLLNVSISRAKKLFIHVGDMNVLERAGTKPIIKYLSHFKEKGLIFNYKERVIEKFSSEINIENIKDFKDFSKEKQLEIFKLFNKLKEISFKEERFYNSQDIVNKMCEQISKAKKSLLFVVPWINEHALEYIEKNADLSKIKSGKVKVHLRVLYHKNEKHKLIKVCPKLIETFNIQTNKSIENFIDEISVEHGTHDKILIVDREKIFMGSFNYLSSGFYKLDEKFKRNHKIRDEFAILKGPYDTWSYIFNRYETLKVPKNILINELRKFVNNI